jgi:uncharacterized protein YqfB (UPF0267 family)
MDSKRNKLGAIVIVRANEADNYFETQIATITSVTSDYLNQIHATQYT